MEQTDIAYAAGIFDGEGSVDIYNASISKASKSPSFMLRVIISQKDGLIMNWLQSRFGGHVTCGRKDKPDYCYRWDIRSQAAVKFLNHIYPYLVIKKEQVAVAIDFEKSKGKYLETLKGKKGFRTLTPEEIEYRFAIKAKLKSLKRDYKPYLKSDEQVQRLSEKTPVGDATV